MKTGCGSAENLWMPSAESRVLPLARILHYAKREALSLGLVQTAETIDQALTALVGLSQSESEPVNTTH